MREMKVFVGPGLNEDGIVNVLNEVDRDGEQCMLMFGVAHALLEDHADDRAEVQSVTVDKVSFDKNFPSQVRLEFTTSWCSHYGCKDMNDAGEREESESATYTSDGYLIFSVPTPRRPASGC